MRVSGVIVACAVMLAGMGCSGGNVEEGFGKTDVDSINKLTESFVAAYNAKDAAKVAGAFSAMGAVFPPNAATVRGRETVEQYYVARFNDGASGLELETRDVMGSGDLAVADGDYRLVMAPAGGPQRRDRGKFLFVFRELNNAWYLERLMFSSDFAANPAS